MKMSDVSKIMRAEKSIESAIKLLKSKQVSTEKDLSLFIDLRQACNLFDFEMEEKCSKLPTYND